MTGVHSYAIASATAAFAGRTRRQIAVWLLPFVFLLHHQLPRLHQCGIRGDWHGARPGVRRARVRPRHRHFLSQLRGLTDPWRNAGSTVERARTDLRKHDRNGIAHRTHGSRAHSLRTLPRALLVRRSRSRFLSWSDRLSEPLVHPGGPGESDEQLHGCNSCVAGHRILSHNWFAIEGWRWLFFLEGIPAILLGTVAFCFLTDRPSQARWLTADQWQWISQKLEQEKPLNRQSISIGQALCSRTVLLLATIAFLQYFIGYSVIFWLPTILKNQSGLSDAQVGLFGAVPYVVALFARCC